MSRPSPLVLALILSLAAHSLLLVGGASLGKSREGERVPAWHLDIRQPGNEPGRNSPPPGPLPKPVAAGQPLHHGLRPPELPPASREGAAAASSPTVAAIAPAPSREPAPSADSPAPRVSATGAVGVAASSGNAASETLVLPHFQPGSLDNPLPQYPGLSRMRGEAGMVLLRVYVNTDGKPGEIRVSQSSGFPRLDKAAMLTVSQQWRFSPARRGETPVAEWVQVPLEFRLKVPN